MGKVTVDDTLERRKVFLMTITQIGAKYRGMARPHPHKMPRNRCNPASYMGISNNVSSLMTAPMASDTRVLIKHG